jgi:hypothetical protein
MSDSADPQQVNLKDIELTWDTAVKIVAHFVQKAHGKGAFKLAEAGALFRAVNFFSGDEKDVSELQATRVLINGLHVGQAHGSFNLEEAGLLHNKFIPFIETELKRRTEKPAPTSQTIKEI